jgi:hypothetical protein
MVPPQKPFPIARSERVKRILTKLRASDYQKATPGSRYNRPFMQGIAHPGNCPANESLQKLALLEHDKPGDAMSSFRPLLQAMPLLALLFATSATAAAAGDVTTIDLAAEASRPAANDLARATVFAEATGATPSDLARRVNGLIADGLKTARGYSSIKTQSGGTHTYPVYGKGSRIEGWRMRSELTLESADTRPSPSCWASFRDRWASPAWPCCRRRKRERRPKTRP